MVVNHNVHIRYAGYLICDLPQGVPTHRLRTNALRARGSDWEIGRWYTEEVRNQIRLGSAERGEDLDCSKGIFLWLQIFLTQQSDISMKDVILHDSDIWSYL